MSSASRPGAARGDGPPSRFVPGDVVAGRHRIVDQSLVKRRWLVVAITIVVWTLFSGWSGLLGFAFVFLSAFIQMVTLLRWGVVALVVSRIGASLCWLARASDWSAWWAEGAVMALVAFGLVAVLGAWSATAMSGPSREPVRSGA